ncbi:MAG: cation:proton antiporter [Betaproteobacteria bacterium]|nr:cation:proton antiporter [Betaproteobacteria bacterium]
MSYTAFLPELRPQANTLVLFGVLLLAGYCGGELVRRVLSLPRITGYVLVGLALGVSGLAVLDEKLLREAQAFVDIGLGLILFELGRRLDFDWLRRDRWLLATSVAEIALSFGCMYFALTYFGIAPLYAAVAAAIGVSTSPAVVMRVAQELKLLDTPGISRRVGDDGAASGVYPGRLADAGRRRRPGSDMARPLAGQARRGATGDAGRADRGRGRRRRGAQALRAARAPRLRRSGEEFRR